MVGLVLKIHSTFTDIRLIPRPDVVLINDTGFWDQPGHLVEDLAREDVVLVLYWPVPYLRYTPEKPLDCANLNST